MAWRFQPFLNYNETRLHLSCPFLTTMIAPECVACQLPVLPVFVLFVSLVSSNISSLLVYDHLTLLDLPLFANDFVKFDYGRRAMFLPPHLSGILTHLRCALAALPWHKRHRCHRGKSSSQLVKLKAFSAHFCCGFPQRKQSSTLILSPSTPAGPYPNLANIYCQFI